MSFDFSAGQLFLSLFVSAVGYAVYRYGRKQARVPHLAGGVALMVFPYFVTSVAGMLAIGLGLIAAIWIAARIVD